MKKRVILTALIIALLTVSPAAGAETLAQKAKKLPYWLEVDIKYQLVIAYSTKDNAIARVMLCSTGMYATPTPRGTFYMPAKKAVTERGPWHPLMGGVLGRYATRITGSYLFHSILYSERQISSLQRVTWTKLGQRASHGCIRLSPLDAQWIAYNCAPNTRVFINEGLNNTERKLWRDKIKASMKPAAPDGSLGEWEAIPEPTPTPTPTPIPTLSPTPKPTPTPTKKT